MITANLIPLPIDPWRRLMGRVPLLVRLAAGLIAVQALVGVIVDPEAADFTPLALFIAGSLVLFFALMPGEPRKAAR